MNPDDREIETLLQDATQGDAQARQRLLGVHRSRLNRMVAIRLDPRLAARVDPSDVVQEAMVDAATKLDDYLRLRPLPFYLWLRRLAGERIIRIQRYHRSVCRDVRFEERGNLPLPDESAVRLVDRLATSETSPSGGLIRKELRQRLLDLLGGLALNDREVLVMRYLEELSFAEIAAVLNVTENAVKVRHFRALERVRKLIDADPGAELT
jgi:RNA polymerase sigma-70 factor (ECF subfamily)